VAKRTVTKRTTNKNKAKKSTPKKITPRKQVIEEPLTTIPSSEDRALKLSELWGQRSGIIGWLSACNHKNIGARYIVTGFVFFALAGIAALLMRTQLAVPENTFLDANTYDQLFTVHGVTDRKSVV